MASTYFGDLYADVGAHTTLIAPAKRVSAGLSHGRKRYARVYFDPDEVVTISSTIALKTFKSGDRIHSIKISSTDCGSAGDIDLGLYTANSTYSGTAVDDNLFADALDVNAAALSQVDIFDEAALDDFDRGKTLWELLGLSADPGLFYELTVVMVEASTDVAWEALFEIEYTSGD